MKKITLITAVLFTIMSCYHEEEDKIVSQNIVFTWDNDPFDDGSGTVTETVNGITVTATSPLTSHNHSVGFMDLDNPYSRNTGNNILLSYHQETSIKFTFSKPVYVESIVAMSGENKEIIYTFIPLEDGNTPIVKKLIPGKSVAKALVDFNWEAPITSFTVTSSDTLFGFDYLTVSVPNMADGF